MSAVRQSRKTGITVLFHFANRGLPFLKPAFLSFIAVWGFSSKRNCGGGRSKKI